MSVTVKLLLFVGLPLFLLALLATVVSASVWALRTSPITDSSSAPAGDSVSVQIPNAALTFTASTDDSVHVSLSGDYSGARPTLEVNSVDGETVVTGGCPEGWRLFSRCSVTIEISMPAQLDLDSVGENGRVSVQDLRGDVSVETTNGTVTVSGASGELDLRTTNGAVLVRDARSTDVGAETTNGDIELTFSTPPGDVEASSTNGSVTIQVPDDENSYDVQASTVNGQVNTSNVPNDSSAERNIRAHTTNGSVTVTRTQ